MCGILGSICKPQDHIDVSLCCKALDTLRHRGPDDEGYLLVNTLKNQSYECRGRDTEPSLQFPDVREFTEKHFNILLGHRRLSIIDLSPAGHQPMSSRDGRYWIVYNGETYNYLELRDELRKLGHPFKTATDTEVVIEAFIEWGPAMLNRLVGMFALAILDLKEKSLFLARDFFGIKPLYYTNVRGQFAFASEIQALIQSPLVSRQANPQRVYDYLRFGLTDHGDQTMFADVYQLPPAHYLIMDIRNLSFSAPQQYWRLQTDITLDLPADEATAITRDLFLKNIGLHMRSDVPVGSCLSGGIDSSAIVMAMRHLEGDALDLHTVSAIFHDTEICEEAYVNRIVKDANAISHSTEPTSTELIQDIDRLISIQGEPFGTTSIYAQQRVFKLASERGLKVMLDGQGADEILGGYFSYLTAKLASLVKQGRLMRAYLFLNAIDRLPNVSKINVLKELVIYFIPAEFQSLFWKSPGTEFAPAYMNKSWLNDHHVAIKRPMKTPRETKTVLRATMAQSFLLTSLPMLLRYEDRNSMSHSIESRVPFLTPEFVQFIYSLKEDDLINQQGETKHVFRKAMRGLVPDIILDRRDKIGFATPENQWITSETPWIDKVLKEAIPGDLAPLHLEEIVQYWTQIKEHAKPYSGEIWRCINFIRWVQLNNVTFT
ncbi:MAG: asparagine synthase (glutamine-hydrolyzing) [Deltaproteobacteria bacterium]|nr:asparagine synthase (glutamine-hydrolyzing) [Deltaproteobacteria bacterium]